METAIAFSPTRTSESVFLKSRVQEKKTFPASLSTVAVAVSVFIYEEICSAAIVPVFLCGKM